MLALDGLAGGKLRRNSGSIDLLALSEVVAVLLLLVRAPGTPVVVRDVAAEPVERGLRLDF